MRKLFLLLFILFLTVGSGNAQIFHRNPEKKLFGNTRANKKEAKVKEPGVVLKAKKKQEAKDKKHKKDYAESVKMSQKRTLDIQSPDVQARMKQDKKNIDVRDKEKRKKTHSRTRKAGKKYK